MEYLLSFAHQREDIVLYHLLKNVKQPIRYVDVGANDPVSISVTKFFYDRGGSGINIEPQQEYFDLLSKDRPRDINLAVGISDEAGELTLYGGDTTASFDRNTQHDNEETAHTVPIVTLLDVFEKYIPLDENIHFLKIDVEGWEYKCLKGMDFQRFRPWILCIEAVVPRTDIPTHENWEELVIGQNYVFLGDTHLNRYYVAAERLHELQEFCQPEELDTIYKIITIHNRYLLNEPILSMLLEQKVVLFGAGVVGQAYWQQIQDFRLPLTAWVASWPAEGFPVDTLERLDGLEYDVILIAVKDKAMAEEMREILMERGVPSNKILWRSPFTEEFLKLKSFKFEGKNYYARY